MPGRILILDDDVTRRITLAARLSGAFYDIRVAGTPEEALEQLDSWQPGLLLLADELSCRPVAQMLRRLRNDSRHADLTILVVTAPGAHMGRAELLNAGADDVIPRSEPTEVFQARLRAHNRAREVMNTLKLRGSDLRLPGLAEEAARFDGAARVNVIAPDPETLDTWREPLRAQPGFRMSFLAPPPPTTPRPWARRPGGPHDFPRPDTATAGPDPHQMPAGTGLVLLGLAPGAEQQALRMLAELVTRGERVEQEVLLLAPGANPRLQAQAYELGASAVMPGPFDADEIGARLRLLQARLNRRRALRRILAEGLRASVTDPLTGLHNRRFALPRLAQISRRSAMRGESFAVMVADLDHFKMVNDCHGHAAGDLALQRVARLMQRNLRSEDVLARIGGEEFLAILPGTCREGALNVAHRLCAALRERPIPLPDAEGGEIALTISVGLTMGRAGLRTPEELIADADRALYCAKHAGRDRVALRDAAEAGDPAPDRHLGAGR